VLVLSRRLNESIVLPGLGVTIQVASIKGRCVRIGIEAPANLPVVREELLDPKPELPVFGRTMPTDVAKREPGAVRAVGGKAGGEHGRAGG
jgi:carbon storage regulator